MKTTDPLCRNLKHAPNTHIHTPRFSICLSFATNTMSPPAEPLSLKTITHLLVNHNHTATVQQWGDVDSTETCNKDRVARIISVRGDQKERRTLLNRPVKQAGLRQDRARPSPRCLRQLR